MYHGQPTVTTTDSTQHSMAGTSLGPLLHGASVLLFLAGMTSLFVSLGHLRSRLDTESDTPRRRVVRSLDRLHPEDVEALYLQGIFSALINASTGHTNNEALLVLLPALEKFENVMVEESRRIRTALKDHDKRIENLEEFISRQSDENVQNIQEDHPNKVGQRKARIKVTRSKAQNEVLKTGFKEKGNKDKKEIILKETRKRTSVDVEIVRNETLLPVQQNDTVVVVEDVKVTTILKNNTLQVSDKLQASDTLQVSDILQASDTLQASDILQINNTLPNNDTLVISDTVLNTDPYVKIDKVIRNETENSNFTGVSILVNDTDSVRLGNSNDSALVTNGTTATPYNGDVTYIPDNTTMDNINTTMYNINTTMDSNNVTMDTSNTTMGTSNTTQIYKTTQLPLTSHTVAMVTTSTISPTVAPTKEIETLKMTVLQLKDKINRLENPKLNSGGKRWNTYKKKMRVLEKNVAEMKRRYRKMKSKLNSHSSKISGIAILQSVTYSDMPRNLLQEYEAKKATIIRFDKIERRLTNYRDMVIRNRHEIRDLKALSNKQEHYISELQAGSDRFEHKGRELMSSMLGMEANIDNLFTSLNGYMSDIRWEIRVMLDRVCGDNHLHC